MRYSTLAMLVCAMGVAAGCSISNVASDPQGIKGVDGDQLTHINTRNYAIHLFMVKPIWGDATLSNTVQSFADEAKNPAQRRCGSCNRPSRSCGICPRSWGSFLPRCTRTSRETRCFPQCRGPERTHSHCLLPGKQTKVTCRVDCGGISPERCSRSRMMRSR